MLDTRLWLTARCSLMGAMAMLSLLMAGGPRLQAAGPTLRATLASTESQPERSTTSLLIPVRDRQQPRISIGQVVLVEPAAETPLPIQVGPAEAIPRDSFVRIRGVPASAELSEGHMISPGFWAVPLSVLPDLRISVPGGMFGKSDMTISLVQIDGRTLAEARAALVVAAAELIAPARPPQAVGQDKAGLESAPVPFVPPPGLLKPSQRAQNLLNRGLAFLDDGDIAAARLFFLRAARAGLAAAALALAKTYDPLELARRNVAGVQPDVARARQWYERAQELGAGASEEPLRRLSAR